MKAGRTGRMLMVGAMLLANGCTALKELPRTEYAAQAERRDVVIESDSGEKLEFESIKVQGDTLTGWSEKKADDKPRNDDPPVRSEEGTQPTEPTQPSLSFEERQIMLDRVAKMSVKQVSWKRTGLIGGVLVAGAVAYLLSRSGDDEVAPPDGGGKPPPVYSRR